MSSSRDAFVPSSPQVAATAVAETPRVIQAGSATEHTPVRLDDLRGGSARPGLDRAALEAVRRDAATQGYAEGWAEGYRSAAAEVRAQAAAEAAAFAETQRQFAVQISSALAALDAAAGDLERRMAEPMHDVEPQLAEAAVTLAQTILGRELQLTAMPVMDAVRRALNLAPANRPVTVRLNPEDADAVAAALAAGEVEQASAREIALVPDAAIGEGGCVVECDATRIDAQLSSALDRVWEVLAS